MTQELNNKMMLNSHNARFYLSGLTGLLMMGLTMAQPAGITPVGADGGKGGKGSNNSSADFISNEKKDVGGGIYVTDSNDMPSEQEIREMKSFLLQELEDEEKLVVNYDSVYAAFAQRRIAFTGNDGNPAITKIVPNGRLSKASVLDTVLSNRLFPVNSQFSAFIIPQSVYKRLSDSQIKLLDQVCVPSSFKTQEIINKFLPPIIITREEFSVAQYKRHVNHYFSIYPEAIYLCNKTFVNMMITNQYDKLLKQHKKSGNVVDLRPSTAK
jgi:hypothetical protein